MHITLYKNFISKLLLLPLLFAFSCATKFDNLKEGEHILFGKFNLYVIDDSQEKIQKIDITKFCKIQNVTFAKARFKDNVFVAKVSDYKGISFSNSNFLCKRNFSKIPSLKTDEVIARILLGMPFSKNKSMTIPLSGLRNIFLTKNSSNPAYYIGDINLYLLKDNDRQTTSETYGYNYNSSSINIMDYHYPKKVVIKNNIEKTYEDLRRLFPTVPFQKTLLQDIKFEVKNDG